MAVRGFQIDGAAHVPLRVVLTVCGGQDGDMGEIVNLRRARKAQMQAKDKQAARENRIRHGRTAAEKINDRRLAERAARQADAVRRDRERD